MSRSFHAFLAVALLGGCVALESTRGTGLAGGGTGAIDIVPRIKNGTYRTQTLLAPYTKETVEHVVVSLHTVSGGAETEAKDTSGNLIAIDVGKADLDKPVRLKSLHLDTTYRVRARAYKAAGTETADQISVDAGSFVDVAVEKDDRPAVATLEIQLADVFFSGAGTSSLTFKDGKLFQADGTPSMVYVPPAP